MNILMFKAAKNIGGAEIYNINLIDSFMRYRTSDTLTYLTTNKKFSDMIKDRNVTANIVPVYDKEIGTARDLFSFLFSYPSYLFLVLRAILSISRRDKIDLICLQSSTEKIFLTIFLKMLHFNVVWLEHGPFFSFDNSKEVEFLYSLCSRFADKIITVSEHSRLSAIENKINPEKIIKIHTGINPNVFRPSSALIINRIRKSLGIHKQVFVLGYLGSLCKEKGIEDFLAVSQQLASKNHNTTSILLGDGPLRKKVESYKMNNIILLGFKSDVRKYIGIFDVFLFPTYMEGFPLSLLETMSMGIVPVARSTGGNPELVLHGQTGYLFKDESYEEIAEMIVGLLKDPAKRKRMGKAARERVVKYFNDKRWVNELCAVFEKCVNEK